MFCPRFQNAQESLSSYIMGNYFGKIGRILKGHPKHPDRQNQVQFELKMKPQVGMRVTLELGWDFQAISSLQHPCSHFMCTKGALTLAAGMAPGRGCTCHGPHHSFNPGRFHPWDTEFPTQQKSWILPHHSTRVCREHYSPQLLAQLSRFLRFSRALPLCFNHLWFLNNNRDTSSTCFRQDAKKKKKKENQQLGEQINGD